MTPISVANDSGETRVSKTKVTGFLVAILASVRMAESLFGFSVLPADTESKIGPAVDAVFALLGLAAVVFRGKRG